MIVRCLTCIVCCTFVLPAQSVVAIGYQGDVYSINPATATISLLGTLGPQPNMNSMARDSQENLYIATSGLPYITEIYVLDPVTLVATLAVTTPISGVAALAFDASDQLYAIQSPAFATPDLLYQIDLLTGTATLVGPTVNSTTGAIFSGIQGLALAPGGSQFYAFDVPSGAAGLVTIDPATANTTDVNPTLSNGGLAIQSLTFIPSGSLFGVGGFFYAIDPISGVATPVNITNSYLDIRGMEYLTNGPVAGWSHSLTCYILSFDFKVWGGTPNNAYYFAVAAANPGVAPAGWFFGIDITSPEILAQIMAGPPFLGILDASGNASTSIPNWTYACAGLITVDSVALEFTSSTGQIIQASTPITTTL